MRAKLVVLTLIISISVACGNRSQSKSPTSVAETATPNKNEIKVTSVAFQEGQAIPRQYTCDGINVSPPLEWSGVPKSAKTIAIIADDPDAPAGTWVHWVLYNLPADNIGVVENVPSTETLKAGGFQGKNDFGKIGYGGPCPPSGAHRYFFKVYALDNELPLTAAATKAELENAMSGHIVLQGQLIGTYRR